MSSTHPQPLPLRIGPYRPLKKLGQGGMGVVYSAQDERDERRLVALKVIAWAGESSHDDPAKRFQRETRILERLRHPNIVSFFDVGVHGAQSYLAMELLAGQPLSTCFALPWVQTLPLFIEVCRGMEYLASENIVHRDLSPDNIFVIETERGPSAKILDFGIAKDTAAEETLHNFTKTGLLMGKPQYWSPEQIGMLAPGERIDWRSDVYALGIIFYRVLSGKLPFNAGSPLEYINLHLSTPPPRLTTPEGRPAIPREVTEIVLRMLAKQRGDRPQSYSEIIGVFRQALDSAPPEVVTSVGPLVLTTATKVRDLLGSTRPRTTGRDDLPIQETPPRKESTRATVPGGQAAAETLQDATAASPAPFPRAAGAAATSETVVPTVQTPAPRGPSLAEQLHASTAQTPAPALPVPVPPRRAPFVAAVVGAVVVVAGGAWLLSRSQPHVVPRVEPTPAPTAAAPAGPGGALALNCLPWGRVVSIVNDATGVHVPLNGETTTPVVLPLPPGHYSVQLASGVGDERERLAVEIRPGEVVTQSVVFASSDKVVSLLE